MVRKFPPSKNLSKWQVLEAQNLPRINIGHKNPDGPKINNYSGCRKRKPAEGVSRGRANHEVHIVN